MIDYLIPQWPAPAWVRALCTTRAGGSSSAPYDSLNLGEHVGDDPQAVAANRATLLRSISARPVFLSQVHSTVVVALAADSAHGMAADASLATQSALACTVMVADCLPVLFTNRQGSVVAAAHAGWRGLAGSDGQGVLEQTLGALAAAGAGSDIMAWLGPCIGPQAFEVGDEVRAAFMAHDAAAQALLKPLTDGKWLADLPGLARLRLRAAGVQQLHGNDGSQPWCTVSNPQRFFSHRRDRISGRMAACIWLD
jgi:polyphenol oxidase